MSAWMYGPDGQSQIFNSEDDAPEGWFDHPQKALDADQAAEARVARKAGKVAAAPFQEPVEAPAPVTDAIIGTEETPVDNQAPYADL